MSQMQRIIMRTTPSARQLGASDPSMDQKQAAQKRIFDRYRGYAPDDENTNPDGSPEENQSQKVSVRGSKSTPALNNVSSNSGVTRKISVTIGYPEESGRGSSSRCGSRTDLPHLEPVVGGPVSPLPRPLTTPRGSRPPGGQDSPSGSSDDSRDTWRLIGRVGQHQSRFTAVSVKTKMVSSSI